MKGDGEVSVRDPWGGAEEAAQIELLRAREIPARPGGAGDQGAGVVLDLASSGLVCVVVTGPEGFKSLGKLEGQHGALPRAPTWRDDAGRTLRLMRAAIRPAEAVNLHGVAAGVSVLARGVIPLPPSVPVGSVGLRWSPKDHPASRAVPELPAWLLRATLDPTEARRAWEGVTAATPEQIRVIAEWERELVRERGRVLRSHGNLCTILRRSPAYAGRLTYDEMDLAPKIDGRAVTEGDLGRAVERIERDLGLCTSPEALRFALVTVAEERRVHPVRDYLTAQQWDGVERLHLVASQILSAEGEIPGAMVARWFLSAAARPLKPGCKADTVLVLVGPQGGLKSTFFRVLAGEYFSDTHVDLASKDAYLQLARAWILEWGEIERVTGRRGADEVKAFLSSPSDRFRPPFGRGVVEVPRTGVIVGSTNQRQFLEDDTGSRRFWCVRVGCVNLELLQQWRDQLWAEAVLLVGQGERWWLDADEDLAREDDAAEHAGEDPWQTIAQDWLAKQARPEHTSAEVLDALGVPKRDQTRGAAMRIGRVLTAIGCERRKHRPVREGRTLAPAWCWFFGGTRDGDLPGMEEIP